MSKVRIFAMNDCDWCAGETFEDAKQAYIETVGAETAEECIEEADRNPLTYEKMRRFRFYDDLYCRTERSRSFLTQLNNMIRAGDSFPCFFASSEY